MNFGHILIFLTSSSGSKMSKSLKSHIMASSKSIRATFEHSKITSFGFQLKMISDENGLDGCRMGSGYI